MFIREDWTLFRSLGTLGQKAGVPLRSLAALVTKELTDNALDAGATVTVTRANDDEGNWIYVDDDGPGLSGTGIEIARLFSIRRPLTSSKLVRLPTRGALGNGLRVVTGAVLASGGEMFVETGGFKHVLTPCDDGTTAVASTPSDRPRGTLVGICLGRTIPVRDDVLTWSLAAIGFADYGTTYKGKTSPWWYDSESLFEMCHAAGERPLGEVLAMFRDISPAAGKMVGSLRAMDVTRAQSVTLLAKLRDLSKKPKPQVLGKLGPIGEMAQTHSCGYITLGGARVGAEIPYSIDAYVEVLDEASDDHATILVNRTPITGQVSLQRQKSHQVGMFGCGLRHLIDVGRKPVHIVLSVTTPYMPVTTDGKEPDLLQFLDPIAGAIMKSARKAKSKEAARKGPVASQKDIIADNLADAIAKASGGGIYRYSLRQLFYAVRPYMLDQLGKEPDYNYFAAVITDIEASMGADLPGLYRDARGVIYHPHTGQEIPLGTLNVEKYERPDWTFNKILYSEKEGFFGILKDTGWPERNDCALLTSKGFASRAARDVLDLIGKTQEEIYFFCIHDADASGTLIYQALTEATRARGARKVHVINLGLDPWEALDMGLQVETFRDGTGKRERALPVADYVNEHWEEWLQTQRVELNAMTSPEFVRWLDEKFSAYAEKVVPPTRVLADHLEEKTRKSVAQALASQILAQAGFDGQVDAAMVTARRAMESLDLERIVRGGLSAEPELRWDSPLDRTAEEVALDVLKP